MRDLKRNDSNTVTRVGTGGISFGGLLQIAFIVLKLCKVINWSWWLVMLPTIIPFGLGILISVVAVILITLGSR